MKRHSRIVALGGSLVMLAVGLAVGCGPAAPPASSPVSRPVPEAAPTSPVPPSPAQPPPATTKPVTAGAEYDGVVLEAASPLTATALDWDLTVDPASVVRTLDPLLFGFNHAWAGTQGLLGDAAVASQALVLARRLPMPLNRMGGTDSQDVLWKEMVGPTNERQPAQWFYHKAPSEKSIRLTVGLLEWVGFCAQADRDARFSITFNFWREEPEDHADLVEFLTGIPGENRNGGIDWAERRAGYGHPAPVPVAIWELGNEQDWDSVYAERFPDVEAYIAFCRRTIAAVRQVQPAARFAAGAACSPWSRKSIAWKAGDWSLWHRRILTELGPDLDWVTFHPYYYGMPPATIAQYLDILRDDCQRLGGGRVRVYLSEHAVWPEKPKEGHWNLNWHHTHDLSGTLGTAQFICFMLRRPEIAAAAYHSFNGGPWGTIRSRDAKAQQVTAPYATGIALLWQLLAPFQTGSLLATTARGERADPASPKASADAVASLGTDGRLRLMLVNREPEAVRRLRLGGLAGWEPIAGMRLSAPTWHAVNTADSAPISLEQIHVGGLTAAEGWLMPPRSVVVVELRAAPR